MHDLIFLLNLRRWLAEDLRSSPRSTTSRELGEVDAVSQRDVINWLSENPGWHRTADVAKGLEQGYKGVRSSLAKAAAWRDIESRRDGYRKEWRVA